MTTSCCHIIVYAVHIALTISVLPVSWIIAKDKKVAGVIGYTALKVYTILATYTTATT